MMKRLYGMISAAAFAFAISAEQATAQAADACRFLGATSGTTPANAYDVFNANAQEANFVIRLRNTSGAAVRCRVYFETPTGDGRMTAPGSADDLLFSIARQNGNGSLILDPADANKRPALSIQLDDGQRRRTNPILRIAPGQFVGPGTYSTTVRAISYDDADNTRTTLDQTILTFGAQVDPQGAIYVSVMGPATTGSGKSAVLDLGEIREGAAPSTINFLVQSNGGYRYQVTSQNSGRLQLVNGASPTDKFDDFITYELSSGGEVVATDGSDFPAAGSFNSTNLAGRSQVFELKTEDGPQERSGDFLEGKLSGRYEDRITFSILPE